jgi:hypothetical protein
MTKLKLPSAALIAAAMFATPAVARTSHVTSRHRAKDANASAPGIAVHILVEGFSVFGVQVQYWMLVAVLIVAAAVAFDVWRG